MSLFDVRIGITMGDPSGIGPEICAKAVKALGKNYRLTVIGDAGVWKKVTGSKPRIVNGGFVDLHNVDLRNFRSGRVKAEYGRASMQYLEEAIRLLRSGWIDCVVTCPISKEAINKAGFHYSGHTEYLAEKAGTKDVVMMLVNDQLRFSLVTRHIPLEKVPAALNKNNIVQTIKITTAALREMFGIKKPRLVVCGINPHGSDNGLIGDEENKVILPALKALKNKFPGLSGPLGADVAIAKAQEGLFDGVVAMYHDQALIPLKLTGDETGVNISLGLGFVRTSPLHGTAFDIAGKNIVNPASLIAAIKLAAKCTLNRKKA